MATSVDVHAACENIVNLGETETAVQGGAFEGRAVSGEGDALGDVSAASELDFGSDAVCLQVVGEVFPAVFFSFLTISPVLKGPGHWRFWSPSVKTPDLRTNYANQQNNQT